MRKTLVIMEAKPDPKKKSVEEYWQESFVRDVNKAMRKYIMESPEDPYKKREFLDRQFDVHKSMVAGALVEHDRFQRNLWQAGVKKE